MAALSDFFPWVRLGCPMTPEPILSDAVLAGTREFCKLTHAIEVDVPLSTVAGTRDYAPTLPVDTEIISVSWLRESPTVALSGTALDCIEAQPDASGTSDKFAVVETDPLTIRLHPTPDAVRSLVCRFVVAPTPAATVVDDRLLSWYRDGVCSYAKHYLMAQVGRPWSNPKMAEFEFRRFVNRTSDARIRRLRWRVGAPNTVVITPLA